jgi:hypothetical protein
MTNAEIEEILDRTRARLLEVDATVIMLLRVVSERCRREDETAVQLLDRMIAETKKRHEAMLLSIENKQPANAARLDKRPLQDPE